MYDVIIIGGGPAGLSAAVYAARACLKALLIEKGPMDGGQILNTAEVDNYLGLPDMSGFDLGMRFAEHAKALGMERVAEEVVRLECAGNVKKAVTEKKEYEAKALIYAAGAKHRELGIPGEEQFLGRGVSYCATCDGAFFRGKTVAVIGGGDTALEDALFLAKICKKVYLVHRRDTFRAARSLQERAREAENIAFVLNAALEEILGDDAVREMKIRRKDEEGAVSLAVDGVFVAVGMKPETKLLAGQADMDPQGYLIADESCKTSMAGVYAAGDVRTKALRQIVTAVSDGANAVASLLAAENGA